MPSQNEFLRALESGDLEKLRALIVAGADVNLPCESVNGETPLTRAAASGEAEIVRLLIGAGADVNKPQVRAPGWTPLMFAHSSPAVTRELIAAGADVNLRTPAGAEVFSSPVGRARCGGQTALHFAAAANSAESIRLLIDAGAKVEACDEAGVAPLDLAVKHGRPTEAAEALVAAGAHLTTERLAIMHSLAHRTESDLWCFPWVDPPILSSRVETADLCPTGEATAAHAEAAAPASGGQGGFRCPNCQRLLYSRRSKLCGVCGAVLPDDLVWTDEKAQAAHAARKWARDLADALTPSLPAARAAQILPIGKSPAEDPAGEHGLSTEQLLRRTSCAEEFRHRDRPGFWLYTIACGLLLSVIAVVLDQIAAVPPMISLAPIALIVLASYGVWRRASPICPNCRENIRMCAAVHCHSCAGRLKSRRCEKCAVDNSWTGVVFPGRNLGNYDRIMYCPACGVHLDSGIRRWSADWRF